MTAIDSERPPADASSLAAWFAEGVRAELTALEKDGGSQSYEVLAGKLIEKRGQTQAIFQFIIMIFPEFSHAIWTRFTNWENRCGFLLGNVPREVIDE
jgi:hypothetical protein